MGRIIMILSYEEFCDEFKKAVFEAAKDVPAVRAVEVRQLYKSNRGWTEGISLEIDGMNIAPVIYQYEAYERYRTDSCVSMLAADMVKSAVAAAMGGTGFTPEEICPENAAKCLFLQMLNAEKNPALADSCAHLVLFDLIAVPRWKMNGGSIIVSREFQEKYLGFSDEKTIKTALANTLSCNYSLRGLSEYIYELAGIDRPVSGDRIFLVLGEEMISGACAMLSGKMLGRICRTTGGSYYVIPSSVHELIIVPEEVADDPGALKSICREVNSTVLEPDDFLSDNVYRYDRNTEELSKVP